MGDRRSRQLLFLSAVFVVLQGTILTLSPAVRARSWSADLRWSHWMGVAVWIGVFVVLEILAERHLPSRDRFVLPLCSLLSGLGILTIWRLEPTFGIRQTVWLIVSAAAAAWLVKSWGDLYLLRRYKYLLLGTGLFLTGLTIVFGTSPTGFGPRLWLGCCGLYLQPSEPLKLLLVIYLAAYLPDRVQLQTRGFPLLVPTIVVTALALVLLVAQRDLGSASILIVLYTIMLYSATGRRRVLVGTVLALALAAVTGFFFVDIIAARLESWLNPWLDPSGRSYQVVQSLLSIANGGIVGRGLGIGNPGLVPVAHSDFIYSAFTEEAGLAGSIALLVVYAFLFVRGLVISTRSVDRFHRLLASGTTAYLGIQTLLIIGGDLRMLPLTGVTLPFVSYGGSSLLTSGVAIAMLLSIRNHRGLDLQHRPHAAVPNELLGALLCLGLVLAAALQTWWAVVRGPDLLTRTDNARRAIADRYVVRGRALDRNDTELNVTTGQAGNFARKYRFPRLSSVIGYTHAIYGQAGLEATLDPYLRGVQGNPLSLLIWEQLLFGTPPPGLDIRLTLDAATQDRADDLLAEHAGAIVLMNADSGEVLAMASHPTYDANDLDTIGGDLLDDFRRPLLNRAAQGLYLPGYATLPLLAAARGDDPGLPTGEIYRSLGFFDAPQIRMPVAAPSASGGPADLRISPLQLAIAASALTNDGLLPAARIALSVHTPRQGWVVLPALDEARRVFSPEAAQETASHYGVPGGSMWEWRVTTASADRSLTWYLAGTLQDWPGSPLVVVVLLEDADVVAARRIGTGLVGSTTQP